MSSRAPHSAQHFGRTRELWWNVDYLELLEKRWKLGEARTALDVGCGQGHWTRAISKVLPVNCEIVGVDPEPRWVEASAKAFSGDARVQIRVATAEGLPFPDGSFDLVTCQTVLMHVASPEVALKEMLRVLRSGGRLLAVEPNNAMNVLSLGADLRTMPLEDLLELVRLHETCTRGKAALGEGWNSVGEELPALLSRLGAKNVETFVRDTATPLWPPYDEPYQRAWVEEIHDEAERRTWGWGYADTRRFFLAGGGSAQQFEVSWANAVRHSLRLSQEIKAGRHVSGMGSVNYVVSGVRL